MLQVVRFVWRFLEVAQFLLDRLHLLVEVVLALTLLHLFFDATADALFDLKQIHLGAHQRQNPFDARLDVDRLQNRLSIFDLQRHLSGDRIDEAPRFVDARQRRQHLFGDFLRQLNILFELPHQRAHQRFCRDWRRWLSQRLHIRCHVLAGIVEVEDTSPETPFDEHLDRAVRELQQLQQSGDRSDVEKIFASRLFRIGVAFGDQQDLFVGRHRRFEGSDRTLGADKKRVYTVRIDDHVPQRKNGYFSHEVRRGLFHCHLLHVDSLESLRTNGAHRVGSCPSIVS